MDKLKKAQSFLLWLYDLVKKLGIFFYKNIEFRKKITEILKDKVVKQALKKLALSTNIGNFFLKYVLIDLFEDYAIPQINNIWRLAGYQVTKYGNSIIIRRLNEAENNEDEAAYDSALDDLVGMQ